MSNPKLHYELIFAGVPLFLTFVNQPSAKGYECQKRGTSPTEGFSYISFLLYTPSPARVAVQKSAPPPVDVNGRPDRHALCPFANRFSPYRRRPHGPVQLALCAQARRQNAASDRGHRPRAIDGCGDRSHSGRLA